MAERRTALSRLRSLRYQRRKLREDVERSIHPRGMTVGMPRVAVSSDHAAMLLDALDECESSITIVLDAMREARSRSGGCEDWCERPRGAGCWYCTIGAALEVIDDG